MDDRTVFVGLATTAITAVSTFIVTRTKNRSDLTLDERKAQRDADEAARQAQRDSEEASRKELMFWHTELITRVTAERDSALTRAEKAEARAEQAEARAERLAALLDVAGKQHQRDAQLHRSAESLILRGGEPWGDSGSA